MDTKYKNDFLKEVIVRVDFSVPIQEFENKFPKNIHKTAVSLFPIPEPRELNEVTYTVSQEAMERQNNNLTMWNFYGKNREKQLVVTKDFLYISYTKYESFGKLKEDFTEIINVLFNEITDLQIRRFGLRYINNIELNEPNPTIWDDYLSKDLLCIFNVYRDVNKISRAYQMLQLNIDNIRINYQYGMPNPDYPATIRKKLFVLDYDAYFEGILQTPKELASYIDKFHLETQKLFESAITDVLRGRMNE